MPPKSKPSASFSSSSSSSSSFASSHRRRRRRRRGCRYVRGDDAAEVDSNHMQHSTAATQSHMPMTPGRPGGGGGAQHVLLRRSSMQSEGSISLTGASPPEN